MSDTDTPTTRPRRFKKRYLLLGWLGLELAALPAVAALGVPHLAFEVPGHVAAVALPQTSVGEVSYVVSSNAPFSVVATGGVGPLGMSVNANGVIGAQTFGSASQLPGVARACASLDGMHPRTVYVSDTATAVAPGDGVAQAVVMTFHFRGDAPQLEFTAGHAPERAPGCSGP